MNARTRLLGVDFGTVRIGLAVSDADRKIASPLTTYTRRGWRIEDGESRMENGESNSTAGPASILHPPSSILVYFKGLVEEEEIGQIVVGLPLHTDGREGQKAVEARRFGRWLAEVTGLPVMFWDERFTTVEAERHLLAAGMTNKRRKARRDRVAAQILLQSYLDAGCPVEESPGPLEGRA